MKHDFRDKLLPKIDYLCLEHCAVGSTFLQSAFKARSCEYPIIYTCLNNRVGTSMMKIKQDWNLYETSLFSNRKSAERSW